MPFEESFGAVIQEFMASSAFTGDRWAEATKSKHTRYLKFAANPDCLGAVLRQNIRPALVQAYIDGMSGIPGRQLATIAVFKLLEKWAIVRDILDRPITTGVECEESDGGHTPWSADHVRLAERHCRSDFAYVVTLGANTGQRGSDLSGGRMLS